MKKRRQQREVEEVERMARKKSTCKIWQGKCRGIVQKGVTIVQMIEPIIMIEDRVTHVHRTICKG